MGFAKFDRGNVFLPADASAIIGTRAVGGSDLRREGPKRCGHELRSRPSHDLRTGPRSNRDSNSPSRPASAPVAVMVAVENYLLSHLPKRTYCFARTAGVHREFEKKKPLATCCRIVREDFRVQGICDANPFL